MTVPHPFTLWVEMLLSELSYYMTSCDAHAFGMVAETLDCDSRPINVGLAQSKHPFMYFFNKKGRPQHFIKRQGMKATKPKNVQGPPTANQPGQNPNTTNQHPTKTQEPAPLYCAPFINIELPLLINSGGCHTYDIQVYNTFCTLSYMYFLHKWVDGTNFAKK